MGVFLEDTVSARVPTPINLAEHLYVRERPNLSDDPNVIAGGQESQDDLAGQIGAGTGSVAGQISALETRIGNVEAGKADVGHIHPIDNITGLVARLSAIEQRLTNAGF